MESCFRLMSHFLCQHNKDHATWHFIHFYLLLCLRTKDLRPPLSQSSFSGIIHRQQSSARLQHTTPLGHTVHQISTL